jgi:PAS domain S-box-containing protein
VYKFRANMIVLWVAWRDIMRQCVRNDSRVPEIVLLVLALGGLYVVSLQNYLLFHCLAEGFSMVVACSVFVLAWNSRQFLKNDYLLFLGIAYLFVACFDLLHTLAYKGIEVFAGRGNNLPTQLWIITRYLESVSLLVAPVFLSRKLNITLVFTVYSLLSALVIGSLFYWGIFPDCFVQGVGLTRFKVLSEYAICGIFIVAAVVLIQRRDRLDPRILRLLVGSIVFSVASELAFSFYVHIYAIPNLLGHLFKLTSFYLIYKAIVETGLREPYAMLFRELAQERQDLRESEERYRSLVNLSPNGIVVVGDDRVTFANDEAAAIFGYPDGESLLGSQVTDAVHQQQVPKMEDCLRRLQDGSLTGTWLEECVVRRDGSSIDIEVAGSPLLYRGKPAVQIVMREVTERKEVEKALEAERRRLFTVLDFIPGFVYLLAPDYSIRFANRRFKELYGKPNDLPCYRIFKGRDEPCRNCQTYRVFETKEDRRDQWTSCNDRTFMIYDHLFTDSDGSELVLEMGIDITDRNRLEQELQENRDMLNSLLQAAPISIRLVSGGVMQWVNDFTCEMLGYAPSDLIGKSVQVLYENHEEHRRVDSINRETLKTQDCVSVETCWKQKDGSALDILLTSSLISQGDTSQVMVSTALDITERKAAENKIKASLAEKEVLLREIHHRVKNNLAVVSSLLGLQSDHATDEVHRTMFEDCQARVRSMAQAHELLYQSENLANLNVREYVARLVDHLITSTPSIGAAIEIRKDIDEVAFNLDTAIPIGLLLTELVSNCLKHAFPGDLEGEVNISLKSLGDDTFELRVKDNGVGIPGEVDIKQPATMGFDLVDAFVDKLRGSMEIKRDKGTEFIVRFRGL